MSKPDLESVRSRVQSMEESRQTEMKKCFEQCSGKILCSWMCRRQLWGSVKSLNDLQGHMRQAVEDPAFSLLSSALFPVSLLVGPPLP